MALVHLASYHQQARSYYAKKTLTGSGPYEVIKAFDNGAYVLKELKTKKSLSNTWNAQHLKKSGFLLYGLLLWIAMKNGLPRCQTPRTTHINKNQTAGITSLADDPRKRTKRNELRNKNLPADLKNNRTIGITSRNKILASRPHQKSYYRDHVARRRPEKMYEEK
ncbi:hypothetical protein PanWU01x14_322460 [Parasponia andersonii]|uniref:Uncharacterized protein n=1 Tax=Parasponia andersonii TaxID=3476 RepID=A0A2P5AKX1_PARAD|nr:hypothetical protein PanWU01x14_322460 [Parasponia andersonii]